MALFSLSPEEHPTTRVTVDESAIIDDLAWGLSSNNPFLVGTGSDSGYISTCGSDDAGGAAGEFFMVMVADVILSRCEYQSAAMVHSPLLSHLSSRTVGFSSSGHPLRVSFSSEGAHPILWPASWEPDIIIGQSTRMQGTQPRPLGHRSSVLYLEQIGLSGESWQKSKRPVGFRDLWHATGRMALVGRASQGVLDAVCRSLSGGITGRAHRSVWGAKPRLTYCHEDWHQRNLGRLHLSAQAHAPSGRRECLTGSDLAAFRLGFGCVDPSRVKWCAAAAAAAGPRPGLLYYTRELGAPVIDRGWMGDYGFFLGGKSRRGGLKFGKQASNRGRTS
ncbi:hypothetical protein B0T17DRAFT_502506 [Bombardia bombarda]|uniref:Uncharacterized protein n=1 Tax=Bombardia bombarda TaxID=252184 RepID=A0AA40CEW7_9PEZI|nr:hypothetical protein B0T17DRAFT_502506 [Bombardia bombarda]